MKKNLLFSFLILVSTSAVAQTGSGIFAVTAEDQSFQWIHLKQIDATKGKVVRTIYDGRNQNTPVINAVSQQRVVQRPEGEFPTATMVAAAAYSGRLEKLFFIPMRIAELRWAQTINNHPVYFSYPSEILGKLNLNDDANHITRMCIGDDGRGYALTNDGNHLFRFSTGDKPELTDLGSLTDAAANKGVSIQNRCTSWGGDMVAGTDGNLYLITQRNYLFRFKPDERVAVLLGQIKNLPEDFTTNGAAVNEKGELIIACSNGNRLYYFVDADKLTANPVFTETPGGLNTSDLASAYLLPRGVQNNGTYLQRLHQQEQMQMSVYPNPVTENKFQIQFEKTETGIHTIQVLDLSGKMILSKVVNISSAAQFETIELNPELARGMYMIKVINSGLKTVYTNKVMVQ